LPNFLFKHKNRGPRRYRDYDFRFLAVSAALCYLTFLTMLVVSLWPLRHDVPLAFILACLFIANAAAWHFLFATPSDDREAPTS